MLSPIYAFLKAFLVLFSWENIWTYFCVDFGNFVEVTSSQKACIMLVFLLKVYLVGSELTIFFKSSEMRFSI